MAIEALKMNAFPQNGSGTNSISSDKRFSEYFNLTFFSVDKSGINENFKSQKNLSLQEKKGIEKEATKVSLEEKSGSSGFPRQLTKVDQAVRDDLEEVFHLPEYQPGKLVDQKPFMFMSASGSSGSITLNDLSENCSKSKNIFQKHLKLWMKEEKIQTPPSIELDVLNSGRVAVTSNHPDKDKIETFINDNEEMRNLYVGITSTQSMIEIGRESVKFQARYAVDPKAAVAEYSHFFSGHYRFSTTLTISKNDWTYNSKPIMMY
ncbi:MAG: hypothetical protein HQM10_25570 [Candidatus Riflebacteria bacterium]|nr:hypothetical protein [Candidatus Riflebacteria bacterium]